MKKGYFILLAWAALTGCIDSHTYCENLGFSKGTIDYAKCVIYKDHQNAISWQQAIQGMQNNIQPSNTQNDQNINQLLQNRRRTQRCTSNFIGNTMYTNCN